jgi:ubiquitin-protein ligase
MADPRALRTRRLNNEYDELMRINGSIIQIQPIGNAPYESYKIIFNIRTIISPSPTHRAKTVCTLTIPPGYPDAAPKIVADSTPYPWHVNWFPSGQWCFGGWNKEESLVNYITRCAKVLQFDPELTNTGSPANREAIPFWEANKRNKRVIPCDTQVLPTLDVPESITINARPVPQIVIKPKAETPKINIIKRN